METKWLGFIDIDEFIVPLLKPSIPQILEELKIENSLQIYWVMYGDSGHTRKTEGLVIDRFTQRAEFPINTLKSIINPRVAYYMDPHIGYFFGNLSTYDEQGKLSSLFKRPASMDKIRINHYWCKTYEEFMEKRKRGDADAVSGVYGKTFSSENMNTVYDNIMGKYVDIIKENIKLRGQNK